MTDSQKTALKLIALILVGSWLGFSPTVHSVTQNAREARSALAAGAYQEGARSLLEIAEAVPWWTGLWEEAGKAAFLAGDYDLAASAYQGALERSDLSDSGRVKLGEAFLKLGDEQAAEQTWLALPESGPALQRLASLYESQGQIAKAVKAWNDYLLYAQEGDDPAKIFYFGLLIASDTPPKALPYLDQIVPVYPQAGQVASAIQAASDQEPAYQLVTAGQALAAINTWRLASHAFEKAAQLRPDYPEAWFYWGEALQHLDDPAADPLETLQEGLSLDPESPLGNLFLGLYWQRKGSHETALDFFRKVEESWPERGDLQVEEGKSLAALGELDAALAKYQAAVDFDPQADTYYRQLAVFTISFSYQIREVGLPAARQAVLLNDQDPANLDVLGQALLALGDKMNAVKLFQQAVALDPSCAPAYYHLGIYYSAEEDRDRAGYYLRQALAFADNPALIDQVEHLLSTY